LVLSVHYATRSPSQVRVLFSFGLGSSQVGLRRLLQGCTPSDTTPFAMANRLGSPGVQ